MTIKPANLRLGSNMKHALDFATRWQGWHSFAKDRATVQAVTKLKNLNIVEVNKFNQFRKVL